MTIQMIPARNCVLSKTNVRRTAANPGLLAQLKADIAARGVLQNLIGFGIPKKAGKFEITAGGRRLASVHELVGEGAFPKDYAIPVLVLNDSSNASETSLAENYQRQPMNPADECTAFRHFIDVNGASPEDVAKRFGVTTRFVEGRIRLAGLATSVFEALRDGAISLDAAQAYGTTSDADRQEGVFEQMSRSYNRHDANVIRRMMTYRQATELGGQVRKGEKSTIAVFYKSYGKTEQNPATGEGQTRQRRVLKTYNVFNVGQIDGLPDRFIVPPEPRVRPPETHRAEIDAFIAASGATIIIGGCRACYIPSLDIIHMPPWEDFESYAQYGAVAAHELTHWTGHSARWTPAMLARLPGNPNRSDYATLLQRFGFGKPDRERALASFDNALTMIVQDEIQAYRRGAASIALGEMNWHALPWPREALEQLGPEEVRLRLTLSYFVEPNPSRSARQQSNRYPSVKLRFFLKGIDETADEAIARVNQLARGEGYEAEDLEEDDRFTIGPTNARRGSLHHDVWTGPASDLLLKDGIGVMPVKGWWGDKKKGARWLRKVPYSLVASIETVEVDIEAAIYQEVAAIIENDVQVAIENMIG